jgi:hypothetical protein
MPAGNTYVAIATQTLGSAAASVTFSSIPSTYTDLVLVVSAQNTSSLNNGQITFNGDTSTNYSGTYLQGNSSNPSSGRVTNTSNAYTMEFTSTGLSPLITNIMNYSNTTTFKTLLQRGGSASDRTAAWVNLWRSTSAITSLSIATFGGNFATNSTFSLYGIASA